MNRRAAAVVAVIKNDWAQPNPKWFKTSTNRPCL
jgi:hypothetical protein